MPRHVLPSSLVRDYTLPISHYLYGTLLVSIVIPDRKHPLKAVQRPTLHKRQKAECEGLHGIDPCRLKKMTREERERWAWQRRMEGGDDKGAGVGEPVFNIFLQRGIFVIFVTFL